MLEITEANALAYLRDRGLLPAGPAQAELLAGGVSNIVLRIETAERAFVLKQSRPQLRTRDAWFSDLERIYREQEVMQVLHPLLPEMVPEVLFADRDNFSFAMSHAPEGSRVWKQLLLTGEIDPQMGRLAGQRLGRMHETTARNPALVEPFRDQRVFVQLRADPFYRRVQERRPEVADVVRDITDDMLSRTEALCHGDYTPKNMLVHDAGFMLVDYETACCGDPAMDIGLFLCHLIMKAIGFPERRGAYFDLTRRFWEGYSGAVTYRSVAELQARGLRHFAVCLLARVDGTSPVDYLPEEAKRESVRRIARQTLRERIECWEEALQLCEDELNS